MNTPNAFPAFSRPNSSLSKSGKNGTLCVLLLDESGSMGSYQTDTIGGVNAFIDGQKQDKDNTKITITKFETNKVETIFDRIPVEEMPLITTAHYVPAGLTNLNDALGMTINKVNGYLATLAEEDRPSVIIQVMTDGHENSSHEFTAEKVKKLVEDAQGEDWIFTFVGANIDAFSTSSSLGFAASATSNYSTSNTTEAFGVLSGSVTRMKSMRTRGLSNHEIYASGAVYTSDDKTKLGG